MKLHLLICGFRNASTNLDKKLPILIKIYPNAKIEKTNFLGKPCIKGKNIINDIKLIKLLDKNVDLNINIDFYSFSTFSHVYFDISFDIDLSMWKLLEKQKSKVEALYLKSNIKIKEKSSSFSKLVMECLLPYFDLTNYIEIEKSLDDDLPSLNKNLEILLEKTATRPYSFSGMMSGMSMGSNNHYMIIEDYNNEVDINCGSFENIMPDNNIVYVDNPESLYVCKNKDYYNDFYKHYFMTKGYPKVLQYASQCCGMYLNSINKKAQNIRKNIIDKNQNPYYWKKLKETIEVMDLNFLEFHSDVIGMARIDINDLNLKTTTKYKNECENYFMNIIKNIREDLNEVKYAMSNLSTPSHTHDEAILQKETEKVNERILMLSFIAMAVSSIGLMQSNEIDMVFKILSGIGIFSLPLLYYLVRNFQKKISLHKNEKNEFKKQLDDGMKNIENAKREHDIIKNDKKMPEDFKKDAMKFMQQFIVAEEQSLEKLKKKMK